MTGGAPRLTLATIATASPMGAQAYQAQIMARAAKALSAAPEEWGVRTLTVRSMRSALPGDRRLPLGRLARAGASTRRLAGRALFAGDAVSHRMALELPPSPHVDVVTLHDVISWRFADESAPVPAAVEELRRAAAVICVSEFTAQEAVDLLGIRDPYVVANGVDPRYFSATPPSAQQRDAWQVDAPYVLHAGGAAERKNLAALAEAWPVVRRRRPELTLVLAGPTHPRRTALFQGLDGVRLLGRLPDAEMPQLVAGAAAVVVPSLYEGFGLPVLEAMAAGVVVVAANTSSLPEVAAGHAMLVEPDARSIAAGVIDATSGDAEVAELIDGARRHAAEYTWERSAAGHAAVWAAVR